MGAEALPQPARVYLHCHSIFSGESAQIRKLSKVTQLLVENKESIRELTVDSTIPAIASVAAQLLKDKIFESPRRAIKRFPELSEPSAANQPKVNAGQDSTPKSVNKKVKVHLNEHGQDTTLRCDNGEGKGKSNDEGHDEKSTSLSVIQSNNSGGCQDARSSAADRMEAFPNSSIGGSAKGSCSLASVQHHAIPELQPVYLPFKTQHSLLNALQRMLEGCCFEFGHAWVPDLMKDNGWREVEALELTQWTQWFPKVKESLPAGAIRQIEGKSVADVLSAVGVIRHAAVHRVRTSAEEISVMLGAAETFANLLYDESRVMQLEQMKTELNTRMNAIEGNQTLMRCKLTEQLEDIARRRAELDRLEKAFIEDYRGTDEKRRIEAGVAIEVYLDNPPGSSNFLNESEDGESSDELEDVNAPNEESGDVVTLSFSSALQ